MIEYSQTLIGRTIIGSLERGSKSFDKLLKICHSIFPDELQAILDGMVIAKLIQKKRSGHNEGNRRKDKRILSGSRHAGFSI